jgi:hypothetical protein
VPIIKFLPRDILVGRATAPLRELARFDCCDLAGEFEEERFSHYAELRAIQAEAEQLGENWLDIYWQVVHEVEIYESDWEPEGEA